MLSLQGRRTSNQDRILVVSPEGAAGRIIAAVADGLGGMYAGDKAAEIAVQAIRESADDLFASMERDFHDVVDSSYDAYQMANMRIRDYAESQGKPGAVGTTLTLWVASGTRSIAVNIGDSRCYAIDGGVRQITRDHSVADELLSQGVLSPADYPTSPLRHQLTKSLGATMRSDPDIFPHEKFGGVISGETILLCSDGFYAKLTDEDPSLSLTHEPETHELVL